MIIGAIYAFAAAGARAMERIVINKRRPDTKNPRTNRKLQRRDRGGARTVRSARACSLTACERTEHEQPVQRVWGSEQTAGCGGVAGSCRFRVKGNCPELGPRAQALIEYKGPACRRRGIIKYLWQCMKERCNSGCKAAIKREPSSVLEWPSVSRLAHR